ncbi:hypothetical protein K0H71_04985 [Bacillus sp. IITD106]|nr:hypothetical protein [Bacillus sp. IITD106]
MVICEWKICFPDFGLFPSSEVNGSIKMMYESKFMSSTRNFKLKQEQFLKRIQEIQLMSLD